MSKNFSRSISSSCRSQISVAQYKRLTGKKDDELQRIFEKEMRLGVLSTQNLLYPFPGTNINLILSKPHFVEPH